MKKLFLIMVLLTVGAGFYLTPHLTIYNMKNAANNRDAAMLSNYVDYPALRENLKSSLKADAAREFIKKDGSLFKAFGSGVVALLAGPVIDSIVTPEGVAMLMRGEKEVLNNPKPSDKDKPSSPPNQKEKKDMELSVSYESFNAFILKIKQKNTDENPVQLVFRRDGIIGWKLCAMRI